MNISDKKRLVGTLSLESQDAELTQSQAPSLKIGAVVTVCALLVWFSVQLLGLEHEGVENAPARSLDLQDAPRSIPDLIPLPPEEGGTNIVFQAAGYTAARHTATVSARTTAVVESVYVEEGDTVVEGMLLAQLDDRLKQAEYKLAVSKHAGAEARVAEVAAELAAARRRMNRIKALTKTHLASTAELDEAMTQVRVLAARLATVRSDVHVAAEEVRVFQVALEDFRIRAPFDGVITERSAQPGEIVSPISAGGGFTRTGIATLVDMSSLEIEVDVNETFIGKVRSAHPVKVTLTAYPDVTYSGKVIAIIPKGDRNKGTVRVRIMLIDGDSQVLPEMGARVDFLMV